MTGMDRSSPLALLEVLTELTEAQLTAAISLDGSELAKLNSERADVVFSLQIALQELAPGQREALIAPMLALRAIEDRLARVARTVVGTLDKVIPRPESPKPNTYGRTGRMG